jgi:hypothetical protein
MATGTRTNGSVLKLTVNEDQTRICKVPEGEFNFLGFTFGQSEIALHGKFPVGSASLREFKGILTINDSLLFGRYQIMITNQIRRTLDLLREEQKLQAQTIEAIPRLASGDGEIIDEDH